MTNQWMLTGRHHHQLILEQQQHVQPLYLDVARQNPQISTARTNGNHNLGRQFFLELDIHIRKFREKSGECIGQKRVRCCGVGQQSKSTLDTSGKRLKIRMEALELSKDVMRVFEQDFSRGCERNACHLPHEQTRLEGLFKVFDSRAGGGQGEKRLFRGAREIAGLSNV